MNKQYELILQNQVISETHPGTILKDFDALLNYVRNNQIELSAKTNNISLHSLESINTKLSHPLRIKLQRPFQKSYPNIDGLFLLLRTSGIGRISSGMKKQILILDEETLQSYQTLNPTERYFTLLEAWLDKADPKILGDRHTGFGSTLYTCYNFYDKIPKSGHKVASDPGFEEQIKYFPGMFNIALLELFGFIRIEHCEPKAGKGWCIDKIYRRPFGDAIFQRLSEKLEQQKFDISVFFRREEIKKGNNFGQLQSLFQPFFPAWKNNLKIPEFEFRDGTYIFKVSLSDIWRRIAIPATMRLEDLSDAILDAFEFDKDHLYCFTYKDIFGNLVEVDAPQMEESPATDEVQIGELPLQINDSIDYLFDFGDQWEFDVKLERIDPVNPKIRYAEIIESQGESPEQYPGWDESDEEDEFEE